MSIYSMTSLSERSFDETVDIVIEELKTEDHAGLFLPCNVVVRELGKDEVEVTILDPVAAMQAVSNPRLKAVALQVREKIEAVIERI